MDKCSLCGDINIYYKKNNEHLLNAQTNENDNLQILADRLLKFEGYERTNKDYPIWLCEECRKSLENFAKLLKIIRNGREKDKEQVINIENEHDEISANKPKYSYHTDDLKEPFNEPPIKRLRRPPKRFLDYNAYIPPKPIKIQKLQTPQYLNASVALLPKIAEIRFSTGRIIGQLREADNYDISSKFRITCTICSLVFCFEREFRKHFTKHREEEMANNLEDPMQTIMMENFLYYCEICQKSFQEHFAVRRHYKQAHSEERPFQCEHCSSRFKYKFNFDYHLAKHLNQRNYQCSLCSKNFILRYELLIHQRTHTNEKPYKCQFCSISFAHRSNLVTHRRLHTQKKTLKCSMCEATFKSLNYLKKHEKNHRKNIENLLQTSPRCGRLDEEEENAALNTALPNFDTLQSTLMSARLNNNHYINNLSTGLNASINDINVSNTPQPATCNDLHGLTFENILSSLPHTFQVLKIPTTANHYNNLTLRNGEVLKTTSEPKSFQIGNTTLKMIVKPQKINNDEVIEKSNSFSMNEQNLCDFKNTPIISKTHSTMSTNLENQENYKFSLENHINSLKSKETSNNDMMNLANFQNSPNQIKMFFKDISATNPTVHGIALKSKNIENQGILAKTTDIESSHNYNVYTNLKNFTKKSTLLKKAEEMSTNLKNQKNLVNTTDNDSSHNFNDFSNLRNSPLRTALNQEKLVVSSKNSSYGSFSNIIMTNFKNSTKSTNFENQKNVLNTTGNDSTQSFNDFTNLRNSPNVIIGNFKNSTKSPNFENLENHLNAIEIDSTQNINDFSHMRNSPKKSTLLKTAVEIENHEKLDEPRINKTYGSFNNIIMTKFKNSTKSPNFENQENHLNTIEIDSYQNFSNISNLRNSSKKSTLLKTAVEKSPHIQNQEICTEIEAKPMFNTTEIDTTQNFNDFSHMRNSPKKSTLLKSAGEIENHEKLDEPCINSCYDSFSNDIMTNFKNSTKSPNLENQENHLNTIEIDSYQNFSNITNLRNSPKKSTLLKTAEEKSPHIQNQEICTEIDAAPNLNDFLIFKNSPKKSTLLKTATNQEKLFETGINKPDGSFSNVSSKTTNIKDPQNLIFLNDGNLNSVSNLENPAYNNLANSPKKISLLKIKENPVMTNNSKNSLAPSICVPKINMKSFKIVKISGDYLKNKFKTITNSPFKLDNSISTKVCNNIRNSPYDLNGCKTQMPKLKYFTNNDKIMKNPLSSKKNIINLNDLTTKSSNEKGFITTESCLKSSSPQVQNKEIFERNSNLKSGEFSKVKHETHLPLNLVARTNVKEIKLSNTLNLNNNLISIPKDSLNLKTLKLSKPLKLVKISTLHGSLNMPSGNNTTLKSKPREEMPKSSIQIKENSSTSIVSQPDLTYNNLTDLKANLSYNINKSHQDLKFSAKPVKIVNIKHLKNSSIDFNAPQNKTIHIIRKSKDFETPQSSTPLPRIYNSLVTNSSPTAVNLQTTPVKLHVTPHLKPPANAPVMSLLKPKTTSSQPPLITNIEILAPLKPLQNPPTTPSTSHSQNCLKQIVVYKFQCDHCWKYFKQKSALQRHLRTHTGVKPYKCNLCPKSYADASNYKKHKILHKNAAEALNINRPFLVSPGNYHRPHSPTHSTASDPDPDGIEIMKTIKKFHGSSSSIDEADDDDDDIESTTSSSMESYMWQQALGYAIKNDEIRNRIIKNLSGINNSIMPSINETVLHDPLTITFPCEDPD